MIYLINFVLRLNIKSTKLLGVTMPNNSLINIAQVLVKELARNRQLNYQDMLINNGSKETTQL